MTGKIQIFQVKLIGPSGLVYVHDKPQEFEESGHSIQGIERALERRGMGIDPITGTSKGHFLGCWISISEIPDDENRA